MLRNGLEPWHLLVVAIVLIVLFGSKKLPDTARSLGRSMRILKSEAKALKDENATTDVAGGVTSGAAGGAVADAATGVTSSAVPGEPPAAAR
ncbi:Sec-independent protein translocase subunit TatA [Streptomyces cellulosae]|uniref:Sec-independent protein translocase subunit TatA n=1 Tax=Streptomyces cellulosae TaxID=1968 RepID=UPI0004C6878C|nr:Sec-independent protein translocase subunit TatA [Streptomyces cellulosae]